MGHRLQPDPKWKANLLAIYRTANAEDIRDGIAWYSNAKAEAARIARKYGYSTEQAAGVISALSPSLTWERNVAEAERFLATHRLKGRAVLQDTFGVYGGANKRKAYNILQGENPHEALTSKWGYKKQLAFYHCIIDPANSEWICIDGHASSAADGWRAPIGANDFHLQYESAIVRPAQYRVLEIAYRNVAREVGLSPCQFQAVVWLVWRRLDVGTDVKHLEVAA